MNSLYVSHRKYLITSVGFSIISSVAISFIAFTEKYDMKWIVILIAFAFWLGLIGEQFFFWFANSKLKKLLPSIKCEINPKLGLISFFKTPVGMIADITFLASLVALIVFCSLNISKDIQFILFSLLVLSFRLHCIFNGKNFLYSNFLLRRDKNG